MHRLPSASDTQRAQRLGCTVYSSSVRYRLRVCHADGFVTPALSVWDTVTMPPPVWEATPPPVLPEGATERWIAAAPTDWWLLVTAGVDGGPPGALLRGAGTVPGPPESMLHGYLDCFLTGCCSSSCFASWRVGLVTRY